MKYLMLYRGYPRKSIQNATAQQINKMPADERAKYIQIPMTGDLEDVLRVYIEENKIKKRDARVLAAAFGLSPAQITPPDRRGRFIVRHAQGGVPISATISRETYKEIEAYKEKQKIPTISEAVDELILIALEQTKK